MCILMSDIFLAIFVILAYIDGSASVGPMSTQPLDLVQYVGEDVTLSCRGDNANEKVIWQYAAPPPDTTTQTLYSSLSPMADAVIAMGYSVHEDSLHDLHIDSVQYRHVGIYTCLVIHSQGVDQKFIQLAVVGAFSCSPQPPNHVRMDGASPGFQCLVEYLGDLDMELAWMRDGVQQQGGVLEEIVQEEDDEAASSSSTSHPTSYRYGLEMTSSPDIDEVRFDCRLSFPHPSGPDVEPSSFVKSCHSHVQVEYHPRDTQFIDQRGVIISSTQDHPLTVRIGQKLNCSSHSRPASRFHFQKLIGAGPPYIASPPHPAHNVAQLEITHEMIGIETTYKCVATNSIKGQDGRSESGVTFVVDTSLEPLSDGPNSSPHTIPSPAFCVLFTLLYVLYKL